MQHLRKIFQHPSLGIEGAAYCFHRQPRMAGPDFKKPALFSQIQKQETILPKRHACVQSSE